MLKQQPEMLEMGMNTAKVRKIISYSIKLRNKCLHLFLFGIIISSSAWSTVERWPDETSDKARVFCFGGIPSFSLIQRLRPATIWTGDINQCEFFQVDPPFDFESIANMQGRACLHSDHVIIEDDLILKAILPLNLEIQSVLTGNRKEELLSTKVLRLRLFKQNQENMILEVITPEMNYDVRSLIQLSGDLASLEDPANPINLKFESFLTSPDWSVNARDRVSARIDFLEPSQAGFTAYDVKVGNQMRWISSCSSNLTLDDLIQHEALDF